jgi:hypothetical protein
MLDEAIATRFGRASTSQPLENREEWSKLHLRRFDKFEKSPQTVIPSED